MNTLEKALLIKELHLLVDGLEHRSLSFFEIAKSKTRLTQIFDLCDEPIFKKQILKFKSQTQPKKAATDFANQTLFKLSYRGLFQQPSALEQALYQNAESGWGILYSPQQGWQIWLTPEPNRNALISEWGDLDDIYQWMLDQQQLYNFLKTDYELKQKLLILEQPVIPTLTETETEKNRNSSTPAAQQQNQAHKSSLLSSQVDLAHPQEHIAVINSSLQPNNQHRINPLPSIFENIPQTITAIVKNIIQENQVIDPIENLITKNLPTCVELKSYIAHMHPLDQENISAQDLYILEISSLPEISQHIDLLFYSTDLHHWQQRPIYLAEQTNSQGCFIKYLALLGAENQTQAIHAMKVWTEKHQNSMAAIKEIYWENFAENFTDLESLFYSYAQTATLIWNSENYSPFIPAQLVQTQKIIQFEESPADFKTPLLLLKERQKIRVIHGQKRLSLSQTESAYPYLLLERHHGVSWQLLQNIIAQLKSPIDCDQLYEAIQKHISD
ncbi:MAG: hypothetical protein ACN6NJ_09750 [Acinetobacter sp.]